jgi:hypothetical protein
MKRITFSISDDLALALAREAARRTVSVSKVVQDALAAHLGRAGYLRALPFAKLGRSGASDGARQMDEARDPERSE